MFSKKRNHSKLKFKRQKSESLKKNIKGNKKKCSSKKEKKKMSKLKKSSKGGMFASTGTAAVRAGTAAARAGVRAGLRATPPALAPALTGTAAVRAGTAAARAGLRATPPALAPALTPPLSSSSMGSLRQTNLYAPTPNLVPKKPPIRTFSTNSTISDNKQPTIEDTDGEHIDTMTKQIGRMSYNERTKYFIENSETLSEDFKDQFRSLGDFTTKIQGRKEIASSTFEEAEKLEPLQVFENLKNLISDNIKDSFHQLYSDLETESEKTNEFWSKNALPIDREKMEVLEIPNYSDYSKLNNYIQAYGPDFENEQIKIQGEFYESDFSKLPEEEIKTLFTNFWTSNRAVNMIHSLTRFNAKQQKLLSESNMDTINVRDLAESKKDLAILKKDFFTTYIEPIVYGAIS